MMMIVSVWTQTCVLLPVHALLETDGKIMTNWIGQKPYRTWRFQEKREFYHQQKQLSISFSQFYSISEAVPMVKSDIKNPEMTKTEITEAREKELKKLKAAQKAKAAKLQLWILCSGYSPSCGSCVALDFALLPEALRMSCWNVVKAKTAHSIRAQKDEERRTVSIHILESSSELFSFWLERELKKLKTTQKAEAAKLQIWKIIKENQDLDLPAHKVMVTTVFCEEIAKEKCGSFLENEEWRELQETVQSHPVPDLEGSLVQFLTLICHINKLGLLWRDKLWCDIYAHVAKVCTAKLSELATTYEALLDGATDNTWPGIRKLLQCETERAIFGFSSALSGFEMDEEMKEKVLLKLEDYTRGVVKLKAKEEGGRVLIHMKHRFSTLISHDSDSMPWSLKLLSVMEAIRLDDEIDHIEKTLSVALLDGKGGASTNKSLRSLLVSSTWFLNVGSTNKNSDHSCLVNLYGGSLSHCCSALTFFAYKLVAFVLCQSNYVADIDPIIDLYACVFVITGAGCEISFVNEVVCVYLKIRGTINAETEEKGGGFLKNVAKLLSFMEKFYPFRDHSNAKWRHESAVVD
ncbi:hypothetical protein ACH5RR_024866 [Cinchona calisaya]|uniref:Sey1/RHD3-like three-helix bundle domain-containing protein n=1 Tax=Cinchona calisaya TaxID=153742 RepID=A0ABD2YZ32_9GENT